MRATFGLMLLAGLTACTATPPTEAQLAARSERDAALDQEEARALAGLVPGEPIGCIQSNQARGTQFIGERSILYRVSSGLIYRNDPPGGCLGLRDSGVAIVTSTPSTSLCRGEIVRVVDTAAGVEVGGCALGDFVPYRRAD